MAGVSRAIQPLEGVKFLSLNNRSHLRGDMNPQKLVVVDAVLRDLEVYRILREPPEVPAQVIEEVEEAPEEIVVIVDETQDIWREKRVSAKIPFLATIQYENLELSSDVIYKLIASLEKTKKKEQNDKQEKKEQHSTGAISENDLTTEQMTMDNLENKQAQRLMELSEWRQQLMRKVALYDEIGNVLPPPKGVPDADNSKVLELEYL